MSRCKSKASFAILMTLGQTSFPPCAHIGFFSGACVLQILDVSLDEVTGITDDQLGRGNTRIAVGRMSPAWCNSPPIQLWGRGALLGNDCSR